MAIVLPDGHHLSYRDLAERADGYARQFSRKLEMINPSMGTLFISAYPQQVLVESRVLFSGCDVLQTPFSEKDLMERVLSILEERESSQTNRVATRK